MNNAEVYKKFKQKALNIIQNIQLNPESKYFLNSQYLNDSKFVRSIPHVMSLSDVWDKIQNDKYTQIDELKDDVNQIFSCAKIFYSDKKNPIYKAANALQEQFNIDIALIPHVLEQEELNSVDQRYIELRILRYKLSKFPYA